MLTFRIVLSASEVDANLINYVASRTATPTPAPAAQQTSLPAQDPTPIPTPVPTPLPIPDGKPVAVPTSIPTPTPTSAATTALTEKSVPVVKTSSDEQSSSGFSQIILAALGVPLAIGAIIVGFFVYRERRRNGEQDQ